MTAQKKDINDPKVINEFAQHVGDQTHLDYLYVLTVADVRGTNPKLWNNWKQSLFAEFYQRTRQRAAPRRIESPIDKDELITGRTSPGGAAAAAAAAMRARASSSSTGPSSPRNTSCATGPEDRVAHARAGRKASLRARSPSTSTTSSCRASRRSPCTRPRRRARPCPRPPCSTSLVCTDRRRAHRAATRRRASTPTACSRATAARSRERRRPPTEIAASPA